MEDINYHYLELLNDQQREAVTYYDGPSLVIAGAGSGKTRVLTYKIVDLLAHGIEPYRLLALTFTNKAAREMKERVAAVVGEKTASRIRMGTFHSVFLRILRNHADLIGYKSGFTIYDSADSKSLIKSIIKDMSLDDKVYKPATIAAIISNAKNQLINARAYSADKDYMAVDKKAHRPATYEIFMRYEQRCRMANAMDFDDILYNMNVLLRDNPDIKRHYQEFFRYILVDEYQDTNFAQHLIMLQLAGEKQNVCVVGDDAQSIYSFRGAKIENILQLRNSLPGLKIFKLERNYRSTQTIVDATSSLISKNKDQLEKHVFSKNEKGEKIPVIAAYSDFEEGYIVASRISQMHLQEHDSFDDYAVLYRTNAQSRILEEALRKRNIPYRIYGGVTFYQRKEIKDVIAYFRLSINPNDDEALRRVINYPARGIGETTMKKLIAGAISAHTSIWTVVCNPKEYGVQVNAGTLSKLLSFAAMIKTFVKAVDDGKDAYAVAEIIYRLTGIINTLDIDSAPETISQKENLKELLVGLKEFVEQRTEEGIEEKGMADFISEVQLATDLDQEEDNSLPKVTLMTAHASKGLEFKHIFVVGVEEDLFPSSLSQSSQKEVEEERRLLYVAMTRAKETCFLSFACSRFRNGETTSTKPSRFLKDIDPKYLLMEASSDMLQPEPSLFINPYKEKQTRCTNYNRRMAESYSTKNKPVTTHSPKGSLTIDSLSPGMKVRHDKFGDGMVIRTENIDMGECVVVKFNAVGEKKLLLKFAKLDII